MDRTSTEGERLRRATYDSPVAVGMVDADGRWSHTNLALDALLAPRRGVRLRTDLLDHIVPSDRGVVGAHLDAVLLGHERAFERTAGFVHEGGHTTWGLLTASAVDDGTGQPAALVVIQDVTERELSRRASQAVSEAPDLASALRALANALAPLITFDRVALALHGEAGLTVAEPVGPASELIPRGSSMRLDRGTLRELTLGYPLLLPDTTSAVDIDPVAAQLARRGIGATVWIPIVLVGDLFGVVALSCERPEPRLVDEAPVLRSVAAAAAAPLALLALLADERARRERLERIDSARTESIGSVAHELRSPLAAIEGIAELLEAKWERISDGDRLELVGRVRRQASDLQRRVEDLNRASRARTSAEALRVEPLQLSDVLEAAMLAIRDGGGRRIVTSIAGTLPPVTGDGALLAGALSNLLDNAVRFSPEEQPVEVTVASRGGEIEVRVRDHGAGIAPQRRPHVFEPYVHFDPDGRGAEGAGLGLHICRSVIEAHGGRIAVDDAAGGGTVFTVRLPVSRRRAEPDDDPL